MKILVTGGRDFDDKNKLYRTLDIIAGMTQWNLPPVNRHTMMPPSDFKLAHGGANGADTLADEWCVINWVAAEVFKADWDNQGNSAGPIRNKVMYDTFQPDLVVAFKGGRGTQHMVDYALRKGCMVWRVE